MASKQESKAKSGSAPKHAAAEAAERNASRRAEKGNEPRKSVVSGQLIPEAQVQQTEPGEGGVADPTVVAQGPGLLPTSDNVVGSTAQVGDVPTRAVGSGFRKEARTMSNGVRPNEPVKDMALAEEHAPDTIFLPNQTLLPSDNGAVVNLPYGSEPASLDPKTGVVKQVSRERNEEADAVSGREVAESEEQA